MPLTLSSPVSVMRGVGEARSSALASLGILTVQDLLRHYPRGYQCRGDVRTVAEVTDRIRAGGGEMPVSMLLTVSAEPTYRVIRRGMSVLKFRAFDATGVCEITYFNQSYLKDVFHTGGEFRFFGRATLEGRTLKLSSPIHEPIIPERTLPAIVPVYRLAAGLSQKVLAGLIRDALTSAAAQISETLPTDVMARRGLCTLSYALRSIHAPADADSLLRARRRLVFEEYFSLGLMMAAANAQTNTETSVRMQQIDLAPLLSRLPYELTGAQKRSISEISSDLAAGVRMTSDRAKQSSRRRRRTSRRKTDTSAPSWRRRRSLPPSMPGSLPRFWSRAEYAPCFSRDRSVRHRSVSSTPKSNPVPML